MNIKIFGIKLNVEIMICIVLVYFLLSSYLVCSCARITGREAFSTLSQALVGSDVNYKMGDGVKGSWENKKLNEYNEQEMNTGTNVPLNGTMFFFKENKGDADHCPSNYSSSTGCIGMSLEQMKYLGTRGGNRSTGEY